MRFRSPFRNCSIEAFYNDAPECVGMKTSRKTCEIHNFSMTLPALNVMPNSTRDHFMIFINIRRPCTS